MSIDLGLALRIGSARLETIANRFRAVFRTVYFISFHFSFVFFFSLFFFRLFVKVNAATKNSNERAALAEPVDVVVEL